MSTKPISVLVEDEHILVVDKPAGMLVVSAPGRSTRPLVDVVGRQIGSRVFAVHRLDEDTTGVLVLARTEQARIALDTMFRGHQIERIYRAFVARVPSPAAGRIESLLAEDRDGVVRSVVGRGGKRAVTIYRTIERRAGGALLECELETGRRNQIRAHLAELGCPIVGDRKYGYRARSGGRNAKRPLLHAIRVRFAHPITGDSVVAIASPEEPELCDSAG